VTTGRNEHRLAAGDVYLFAPTLPLKIDWHDPDVSGLRLPLNRVADVAGDLYGIDPEDMRFDSMRRGSRRRPGANA
jgi:hypothetical protein